MSSYPLCDIFGELPESNALNGALVDEVRLDRNAKAMSIALRLPFECPEKDVSSFVDAVKREYGLNQVSLSLSGEGEPTEADLEAVLARLMQESSSARALFVDCKPVFQDGLILLPLSHGGLGYAKQWQSSAEKELSRVAGRPIRIEFPVEGKPSEENLAKKTTICETIESFDLDVLKTFAEWNALSEKITALQAEISEKAQQIASPFIFTIPSSAIQIHGQSEESGVVFFL